MRPLITSDILNVIPEERALVIAKGFAIDERTIDRAAAQLRKLNIEVRRLLEVLTMEELRSVCTHRGLAASPACTRNDLMELALGRKPSCEFAYLPWWSDPNGS